MDYEYRIRKKFRMGKVLLITELRNIQNNIFVVNPFATTDTSCT